MTATKQLPALIRLLDDESPVVRRKVIEALQDCGDRLPEELESLGYGPDSGEWTLVRRLLEPLDRERLRAAWPGTFGIEDDMERLEAALALLAAFQSGGLERRSLGDLLDELAAGYREAYEGANPRSLAIHLFRTLGLRGDQDDYYQPRNSNLIEVITRGRGIPISLAAVYMLVGRRLGLDIRGCNFPGHFLARVEVDGEVYLVDCFAGGKFLRPAFLLEAHPEAPRLVQRVIDNPTPADVFITRVLNNLVRAYAEQKQTENRKLMQDLLRRMTQERPRTGPPGGDPGPRFRTGQLVRHRRYGYRGVVVDFDLTCKADEGWYRANATQPDRNQPWYNVLVHGTNQATYAAESSLLEDTSAELVEHPLVEQFFSEFRRGEYVRNGRPWPRG